MFNDIRYAIRTMFQNKGWTAVVLLSLALGIGSNTALFSLIDAAFLKQLPVKQAGDLVLFEWSSGGKWPVATIVNSTRRDPATNGVSSWSFSYDTYQKFRDSSKTLSALVAFCQTLGNLDIDGYAESATGQLVSANYFNELGVSAARGRTFADFDDTPSAEPAVVISDRFWQRRFGSDPNIIGRKFRLNGVITTIIGVTEPGFEGALGFGRSADFSLPLSRAPRNYLDRPSNWWIVMLGRVRPGMDRRQVHAELERVFQASALETYAGYYAGLPANSPTRALLSERPDTPQLRVVAGGRGLTKTVDDASNLFFSLIAIFAFLLLLVWLNVVNLLLARSATRRQEIGVRLAIGAGRLRLVRQLLTEGLVMAGIAGLMGFACAYWGKDLLAAFLPQFAVLDLSVDHRVLAFTAGVALITGTLFGLAPALRLRDLQLHSTIKEMGRGIHGSRSRTSQAVLIVQVSALVVLLIGAGLFFTTLRNLRNVDVGFSTDNLLMSPVIVLRLAGYNDARITQLHDRLLERVQSIPGVAAAATSYLPMVRTNVNVRGTMRVIRTGLRTHTGWVDAETVSSSYFDTLGVSVIRGRSFGPGDHATSPQVAVINETLARQSFPNADPVGTRYLNLNQEPVEIIGVIKDVKHEIRGAAPAVYTLISQSGAPYACYFYVRAAGDPAAIGAAIRDAMREIEPALSVSDFKTLDASIQEGLASEHILASASSFFSGAALLLAAIGLYGVMSFSVTQRTGEIGIRMALGAARSNVAWLVLRESVVLTLIGSAIGLAASLAMTRLLTSLLFGVEPTDPWSMSVAVALMVVVAALAGYIPARRASRIDPMVALRHE